MLAHVPFALIATLLFFGQAVVGRDLALAPDVGATLAVYLGLFARRGSVSAGAAVLGILRSALDLEPVGSTLLIYLAIASVTARLRDVVFRERIGTQWVVAFIGALAYVVLHAIASQALGFSGPRAAGDWLRYTAANLFAALLAPGIFGALRLLRVGP